MRLFAALGVRHGRDIDFYRLLARRCIAPTPEPLKDAMNAVRRVEEFLRREPPQEHRCRTSSLIEKRQRLVPLFRKLRNGGLGYLRGQVALRDRVSRSDPRPQLLCNDAGQDFGVAVVVV